MQCLIKKNYKYILVFIIFCNGRCPSRKKRGLRRKKRSIEFFFFSEYDQISDIA